MRVTWTPAMRERARRLKAQGADWRTISKALGCFEGYPNKGKNAVLGAIHRLNNKDERPWRERKFGKAGDDYPRSVADDDFATGDAIYAAALIADGVPSKDVQVETGLSRVQVNAAVSYSRYRESVELARCTNAIRPRTAWPHQGEVRDERE